VDHKHLSDQHIKQNGCPFGGINVGAVGQSILNL
jgi:hypothetical protein